MMHCSCVHTAVSAVKASWLVREIKNVPSGVSTRAAPPTVASGEAASMLTAIVRPLAVPATELSDGADDEGEVGLPQAVKLPAIRIDAA